MTLAVPSQHLSTGTRWSEVFHLSKISPYMWVVAEGWQQRVWDALAAAEIPSTRHNVMFGDLSDSAALLDGLVMGLANYGFPGGLLPSGTRVIGPWVMRWLCAQLGVVPPLRKLSVEERVPGIEELNRQLEEQLRDPEALNKTAELGFVNDRDGVLLVVVKLFGQAAAPERLPLPSDRADGRLGEARFTHGQVKRLREAGMADDVALQWLEAGFDRDDTVELAGAELSEALAWRAIVPPYANRIRPLIDAHVDPRDGERLLRAGCPPEAIVAFLLRGLGLDAWETWSSFDIDEDTLAALVEHHVPASQWHRWEKVGFDPWQLSRFLHEGGDIEIAERFGRLEITPRFWAWWVQFGVAAEDCVRWQALELDPWEAKKVRDAGYGPDDVEAHDLPKLRRGDAIIGHLRRTTPLDPM